MRTHSFLVAGACALVALAACSSGSQGSFGIPGADAAAPADTPERESPVADAGAARDAKKPSKSENGELAIVSLTPTVGTVTGGEPLTTESTSVTFIAIVTDKAGLDAIAGGQLMDDSGATYAAFGAGANKGTYSATIDWAQMNSIRAAEFTGSGGQRNFVAKFFDNNGNEATADVAINLACRRSKKLVDSCGGECADLGNDAQHCGACATACPGTACATGKCGIVFSVDPANPVIVQSPCLSPPSINPATTCAALCTAANYPNCTRIMLFSSTDATCGGGSTDGLCTADLSKVSGPVRCRCSKK